MEEFERPNSEQLLDLHIYVVPPDLWRSHLQSAGSQIIEETISAGFIRVHPEASVNSIRKELDLQLEYDSSDLPIPNEYVFLKSVGRCLTQVKPRQEYTLKIKSFQPPRSFASEIFVLDSAAAGIRYTPYSGSSSQSSSVRYNGTPRSDRSEFSGHRPVPPIGRSSQTDPESHNPDPSEKAPQNILIASSSPITNKATQYSRPSTPYRETLDPGNITGQNFVQRFVQVGSPTEEGPQRSKHVVFKSPIPTRDKDRPSTPLSATPPHSPEPGYRDPRYNPKHRNGQEGGRNPHRGDKHGYDPQHDPDQGYHPQHDPDHVNGPHGNDPHNGQQQGTDRYRQPLSATPPSSADQNRNSDNFDPNRSQHGPLQNNNDDDPENHRKSRLQSREGGNRNANRENSNLSDGLTDEEQRKLDDLLRQNPRKPYRRQRELEDSELAERKRREWEAEEERRRRQQETEDERQRRQLEEEEERRRQEEEEERRRREAERRRNEENERRRLLDGEDEERRRREAEEEEEERRRRQEEEDEAERRRLEAEANMKNKRPGFGDRSLSELQDELERMRQERLNAERHREDLVKRARMLQTKTQKRRNQARDTWKKKYFEEKKKTMPLDEQCNRLRTELEALHRKIMSQLEMTKDPAKRTGDNKPSQQSNLKIQATKLQHEIEELGRRVENIKMKLTTEMKLRNQAQGELKALRAELTQKKINMTLIRTSHPQHPIAHTPGAMLTPRS